MSEAREFVFFFTFRISLLTFSLLSYSSFDFLTVHDTFNSVKPHLQCFYPLYFSVSLYLRSKILLFQPTTGLDYTTEKHGAILS